MAMKQVAEGDVKLMPLVSHVIRFEEIGEMFHKLLVKPWEYLKIVTIMPLEKSGE